MYKLLRSVSHSHLSFYNCFLASLSLRVNLNSPEIKMMRKFFRPLGHTANESSPAFANLVVGLLTDFGGPRVQVPGCSRRYGSLSKRALDAQ